MTSTTCEATWSGGRAGALDELLLSDTGPLRIGTYSQAACPEVGDVRQDRHKAHRDRASRRLFGGVGADEPHRGLGAGVPAAHRRSGQSGPARHCDHDATIWGRRAQGLLDEVEGLPDVDVPVDAEGVPVVLVQRGDHGGCACIKDDCSGPVGAEQPRRQFGVGHVTGLAGQRIAEFSLQFLQPTAVAGDADHVRAGFGQGDGRGPPEATAGAGDDHRGAVEIYSCHFVAPFWIAGSAALEVLIRAGAGIHRSVSRAKWGLSIRWQQARGWTRYGPASRAKAPWPPSRAGSSRPCLPVIASAPTKPPPRRPGWTRHFASPTAPPAVRAAPPRRAGGRARSPRRSARPGRTAVTADAASGTR